MTPANAVRAAVEQLASPPANVDVALRWVGGSKPELAARLAGTDNKRSSEYRNALRNVQRWAKGASPTAASWKKLKDALQPLAAQRAADRMARKGINVRNLDAEVMVSSDERWRQVRGVFISGAQLRASGFPAAVASGAWGRAAGALASAWGGAYGIGVGASFSQVDDLDLSWR